MKDKTAEEIYEYQLGSTKSVPLTRSEIIIAMNLYGSQCFEAGRKIHSGDEGTNSYGHQSYLEYEESLINKK